MKFIIYMVHHRDYNMKPEIATTKFQKKENIQANPCQSLRKVSCIPAYYQEESAQLAHSVIPENNLPSKLLEDSTLPYYPCCVLRSFSPCYAHHQLHVPFPCKLSLLAFCSSGFVKAGCTVPMEISNLVFDICPVLTASLFTSEQLVID